MRFASLAGKNQWSRSTCLRTWLIIASSSLVCVAYSQTVATKVFKTATQSVFVIETDKGRATGFLCLGPSTVVTCAHAITNSSSITVRGEGNAVWKVTQVRVDQDLDLALLTINRPSTRKPLRLANRKPSVGEKVLVIGNPLGFLQNTLTEGLVSSVRSQGQIDLLQISAQISPGSSGSPVLDTSGSVLGIASFAYTRGNDLNFAISSQLLRQLSKVKPIPLSESQPQSRATTSKGKKDIVALPLAELNSELDKLKSKIENSRLSRPSKIRSLDDFDRFWQRFQASDSGIKLLEYPDCKPFRALVDGVRSSTFEWLQLESVKNAEIAHYLEDLFRRLEKMRSAFYAITSHSIKVFGFSFSQAYSDALSPAAFFEGAIGIRTQGPNSESMMGAISPDHDIVDRCVISEPIFGPGDAERALKRFEKESKLWSADMHHYPEPNRDRIYNEEASVKVGAVITGVRLKGREWHRVSDWRSFVNKLEELGPRCDIKQYEMEIRYQAGYNNSGILTIWYGVKP